MPWSSLAGSALDLLLPRQCVACEAPMPTHDPGLVCGRCWSRTARLPQPQCLRCGHPSATDRCQFCDRFPPWVRAVRSWCWVPHPVASRVLAALKYEGWHGVAMSVADRLARLAWPADVVRERALVVPVPLSPVRERERGYNQSERIASSVALRWGIPCVPDVVRRTRATATQTKLTPGERSANVKHAFASPPDAETTLRGRHIVLVDDVLTTGATLNECAAVLFEAGARTISYLTFGRARTGLDH